MDDTPNPFEPLSTDELNQIRRDILDGKQVDDGLFAAALQTLCGQRAKAAASSKPKGGGKATKQVDLSDFLDTPQG